MIVCTARETTKLPPNPQDVKTQKEREEILKFEEQLNFS